MEPKSNPLKWLKSRTFWQVTFVLITLAALQLGTANTFESNYYNNYLPQTEAEKAGEFNRSR